VIRPKETATRLIVQGDNIKELKRLEGFFKFRPTDHWRAPSYERFKVTNGEHGWDGFIRPFRLDSDTISAVVPRGYKDMLFEYCRDRGVEVDRTKMLECPFAFMNLEDVPADLLPGVTLDPYQQRCVYGWLRHGIGICNVTVSGGKTITFAAVTKMVKQQHPEARILYITQSERLVRQAYTEMKKYLPEYDITRYGGGARGKGANRETGQDYSGKDMVVATTAVLHRNRHKLVSERFFRTFMCVLYDEVHHAASKSSQGILEILPSYYRFGASDTKKEDDPSKYNAILSHFGAVRAVTPASVLIQIDRVARPNHYLVDIEDWHNRFRDVPYRPMPETKAVVLQDTQWKTGVYMGPVYKKNKKGETVYKTVKELDDAGEWIEVEKPIVVPGVQEIVLDDETVEIDSRWLLLDRAYDKAIVRFQERNHLIVAWARYFSVDKGFSTLVVCTRTLHIYILEAMIKKAHPEPEKVEILFGTASSAQRDKMFEWFRETPGAILISPLVKEGVSINEIRAGVVADNVADWEVANQITGRFMRKKLDDGPNEAEIVWFVDRQHPNLRRNSIKIMERLEKIAGYNFYHPLGGPETLKHALEFKTPDLPIDGC